MNILLMCNRVPFPLKDGGAIAMYNMAAGLREQFPKTTLFALNTYKHYVNTEDADDPYGLIKEFHTVGLDNRIRVWPAFKNLFSSRSYHIERFLSAEAGQKLAALLSDHTFDIIQIEGLMLSVYLPLIRKYSNAKVVLRAHNVEHQIWERLYRTSLPGLKKAYYRLLARRLKTFERFVIPQFDAVVAITPQDTAWFKTLMKNKPVFLSPAGLLPDQLRITDKPVNPYTVFHIGSLDWRPNQEAVSWFIREVWPIISREHPQAIFYVAGRHMPHSFLEMASDTIRMVGEVESAADFMSDKAVMVVPLLSGSGMRLKIIEGMALQKAIVSTHIGAEGIDCINEKDILLADSPEDFADAVSKCLGNPHLCRQIGKNAAQLVSEQYDNRTIIARLIAFYQNLIHQ